MGRPKGSKNKNKGPGEAGESSLPPTSQPSSSLPSYSAALTGKGFGRVENDKQEVFKLRLRKPAIKICIQDVIDYFSKTKHGKSLFGLQSQGGDLITSFHSKEAREDFLGQKVLMIGKAEVHVAPFPAGEKKAHQPAGSKYIASGVPMEATSAGVQKGLHNLNVERYLFERYPNSQVRTGRVIFWSTAKVPTFIYITDVKVPVKLVGLPKAPPNTPAPAEKPSPTSKEPMGQPAGVTKEKPVEVRAEKPQDYATEEDEESMPPLDVFQEGRWAPFTPTHQAQRETANLVAGASTNKRKEISPLASPPAKEAKRPISWSVRPLS